MDIKARDIADYLHGTVDGDENVSVSSISKIEDDNDLFNICYAIAPNSIAIGWERKQLLDTVEDVLLSRF